ncbi:MAG: hypothetical protein SCALA701_35190 [Candidatus Scalindua sp.]|nr:MAG: hypothetical protein SCALA701_35190 [Candidatus Scalindua sp.]
MSVPLMEIDQYGKERSKNYDMKDATASAGMKIFTVHVEKIESGYKNLTTKSLYTFKVLNSFPYGGAVTHKELCL